MADKFDKYVGVHDALKILEAGIPDLKPRKEWLYTFAKCGFLKTILPNAKQQIYETEGVKALVKQIQAQTGTKPK